MKSGWIRLCWLCLVFPIWLIFLEVDVNSPLFSGLGYLLFGMAVWIWIQLGGTNKEEMNE